MTNLPQRPPSHIRGDEAIRIFTSACSPDWIISTVQPDYGLDLRIELTRDNQVTGEEFYVQVKGRKEVQGVSEQAVEVPIAQSTINYWLGKLHPVLIVLVDVSQQRFWFDWLEYSYSDYPKPKSEQHTVNLLLSKNGSDNSLVRLIPSYLDIYFSRLRADLSNLFESTQLTRVLLHVSALHRSCSEMAINLQGRDFDTEELRKLFLWFYASFGLHDEFLIALWDDYYASQNDISPKIAETLKTRLETYAQVREKFFMRENRQEAGDFYLVPVRYSDLVKNLLQMLAVLSEIEDILLQGLVLGKIIFPKESE